ncbi:hypothetical protein EYC84_003455 [Monilinia fructicola]|uniref:Uncharacterized protein n=1 Tax=Monilinia fructicola TaxID=38448 RepID=A0A5M9JYU5_MONFR|nr:hypothetical protein EYC84_003455 [Monilinia fructicola]
MVSEEEGKLLAESWRERGVNICGWGECSSKTREGVKAVFEGVVREVVKRPELVKGGQRKSGGVSWASSHCWKEGHKRNNRRGHITDEVSHRLRLAVETIAILRAALARIYGLTASRIMGFSRVL